MVRINRVTKIIAIAIANLLLTTNVAFASHDARLVFKMLNAERRKAGIARLGWGVRLEKAARRHSVDMIKNAYFAHSSTRRGTLADRLEKSGLAGWKKAGENLAGAVSPRVAFKLWMRSKLHRKNMLSADYTHVGIAAVRGGPYGLMFTMDLVKDPVARK